MLNEVIGVVSCCDRIGSLQGRREGELSRSCCLPAPRAHALAPHEDTGVEGGGGVCSSESRALALLARGPHTPSLQSGENMDCCYLSHPVGGML